MGMESTIKLTVTLSSGRKFVNDEICYWRKNWAMSEEIFKILGIEYNKYKDGGCFKINKGDLQEIKELLINSCNDMQTITSYDYWGEPAKYIERSYKQAGTIHMIQMLQKKKIALYELFPDELEDSYDPNDNIVDILVEFGYYP